MGKATAAGGRSDGAPTPTLPKQPSWPPAATPEPAAVPPGNKPGPAAAPAKAARPGVGDGSCPDPRASSNAGTDSNANPAGQVAAALQAAAPGGFDAAALSAAIRDGIAATMGPALEVLSARLDSIELGPADGSRAGSGAGGSAGARDAPWSDSASSYSTSSEEGSSFVPFTKHNPHWVATKFKEQSEERPRKHNLHNYDPWDTLTSKGSRHEGGGALGQALTYLEPGCAYSWEANNELCSIINQLGNNDVANRLKAVLSSHLEIYKMLNEFRQLVVEQVRSIGSDDPFDKAQAPRPRFSSGFGTGPRASGSMALLHRTTSASRLPR